MRLIPVSTATPQATTGAAGTTTEAPATPRAPASDTPSTGDGFDRTPSSGGVSGGPALRPLPAGSRPGPILTRPGRFGLMIPEPSHLIPGRGAVADGLLKAEGYDLTRTLKSLPEGTRPGPILSSPGPLGIMVPESSHILPDRGAVADSVLRSEGYDLSNG